MMSRPSFVPKKEEAFVRSMWAEVAKNAPAIVYIFSNRTGPRRHGDSGMVFIFNQPYDPLSEAAQQSGHFCSSPNELVISHRQETNGILKSNLPLCGACYNALVYFRKLNPHEGNRFYNKEGVLEGGQDDATEPKNDETINDSKLGPAGKGDTEVVNGDEDRDSEDLSKAVVHHEDLNSLLASVNAGCGLCKDLEGVAAHWLSDPQPRFEDIRLEICWDQRKEDRPRSSLFFIFTRKNEERDQYNYMNYFRMHAYPCDYYASSFDNPISDVQEHGLTTGSLMCQNLAQHWFKTCEQSTDPKHKQCAVYYPDYLPGRLLDAEHARKTGILRLVTTGDMPRKYEHYITLSYVWGPGGSTYLPLLKTTNIDDRQKVGLPVAELPKTLRDAIEVTGWFNVKWLWIDCMCIMQDSPADWESEVEGMNLTYRNAMLNISADAAIDAHGGCFVERDIDDLKVWRLESGQQSWYMRRHHGWDRAEAERTPAYSRAWIFRERQLARRVLHFTPEQLIWECCGTGLASEVYPGGAPFAPFDAIFGNEAKHQWLSRDGTIESEGMSSKALHESWNLLCDAFSGRELTKRSDMPVIISALAADYEYRLPGDTYMSGLWASQMPHCLLWNTEKVRPGNLPERAEDVMAATWSWLWKGNAITMRGRWSQLPVLKSVHFGVLEKLPTTSSRRVFKLGCTGILRKIRVSLVQPNITVAQLHKGDFIEKIELIDNEKRPLGVSRNNEVGDLCDLTYDGYIEAPVREYWCLFVNVERFGRTPNINGLLLKQLDETDKHDRKFRRVGKVEFQGLMALKVRYRVRFAHRSGERRWEQLEREFVESKDQRPTEEDMEVEPGQVDPLWLYRYDTKGDYSWLKRLEPQQIELY